MHVVQATCESEVLESLQRAHELNGLVREKLTHVFGKLELLLAETKRSEEHKRPQIDLISKQRSLQKQLTDPKGLLLKLDSIMR